MGYSVKKWVNRSIVHLIVIQLKIYGIGRARAYVFNIAEAFEYNILGIVRKKKVAGNNELLPIYTVSVSYKGISFTKGRLVDDINKESRETGKQYYNCNVCRKW